MAPLTSQQSTNLVGLHSAILLDTYAVFDMRAWFYRPLDYSKRPCGCIGGIAFEFLKATEQWTDPTPDEMPMPTIAKKFGFTHIEAVSMFFAHNFFGELSDITKARALRALEDKLAGIPFTSWTNYFTPQEIEKIRETKESNQC